MYISFKLAEATSILKALKGLLIISSLGSIFIFKPNTFITSPTFNILSPSNNLFYDNKFLNGMIATIFYKNGVLTLLNNSLKIMRKNEIIHRNLNLENIFLKRIKEKEENYYIKLKLSINSCKEKDNFMIFKSNENILYYSQEILKGEKLDEKIDLWSLGVIIYILAFKEYPYKGERETELLNHPSRHLPIF